MWSQNWQIYRKTFLPTVEFDLEESIKASNWTSLDMVKRADDFYRSLGMPSMTESFWEKSIFGDDSSSCKYHGTAANMFGGNDYRFDLHFETKSFAVNEQRSFCVSEWSSAGRSR